MLHWKIKLTPVIRVTGEGDDCTLVAVSEQDGDENKKKKGGRGTSEFTQSQLLNK